MVDATDIKRLDDEIQSIIRRARQLEAECARDLDAVHPEFRGSAQNLVHYVALRQSDVSELQSELATLGLSSLGRAERNVMGTLQAVSNALQALAGGLPADAGSPPTSLGLRTPAATAHQQAILGDPPADPEVSIMITLPTEAAAHM